MYFRALLFWLLLFSPLRSLPAEWQLQQTEPKAFTVRGKVVNSVTGEAVRGALVQLFVGRPYSRLTGPDGQFVFEEVPAGTFAVQARKPGFFFAPQLPFAAALPPMITAGPDEPPPATLKLIPEGIIYGHVLGDSGEPVDSLPVQIFCERMENGKKARKEFRSTNTDEQGEFRLAELPPGKYFVLAGPSRFPSSFSSRPSQGGARGYAPSFYPSAPDLASAAPIEITPDKRVEINLTLSSQPSYRISGTVNVDLRHQSLGLQLTSVGGQPAASGFQIDPERGTFRSQWVPAGLYMLTGSMHNPSTGQELFAAQNVNLTSNLTVRLTMVPSLNIPVNFQLQTTRNDSQPDRFSVVSGPSGTLQRQTFNPARVVLTLREQALSQRQFYAEAVNGDEAAGVIHNVLPGAYAVEVFPNGPYYVQAVRSGSLNLLEQNLMVGSENSLQPIEVVLRDDFATLEGSVAMEADGKYGMVLIIPEGSPQRARSTNLFSQPGMSGSSRPTAGFDISQLAPGSYRVLAVDDPSFEYANPDVLQKYLSQAQEVLLGPNQLTKVTLGLVHVGD